MLNMSIRTTQAVDRYLVLFALGETVLRFQLLEMSFWPILAMRLKKGYDLRAGHDQACWVGLTDDGAPRGRSRLTP